MVLDNGKLAEEGTPIDLIKRKGIFWEMISKNGKDFENEMTDLGSRKGT